MDVRFGEKGESPPGKQPAKHTSLQKKSFFRKTQPGLRVPKSQCPDPGCLQGFLQPASDAGQQVPLGASGAGSLPPPTKPYQAATYLFAPRGSVKYICRST